MSNSLRKICLIAYETCRENWVHNRWFQLCLLGLLFFVLGCRSLSGLPLGSSAPKLIFDVGHGIISLVSGGVLILLLAYQLSTEIQTGVLYGSLARSVSRLEYLCGKVLGTWMSVVAVVLLADGLLTVLVVSEINHLKVITSEISAPMPEIWWQLFLFQGLELLVLAGLTVCISMLSRTFLFPAVTTLALWFAGMLLPGVSELAAINSSQVAILIKTVAWVLPRFELWDLSGKLWYEGAISHFELLRTLLVGLLYWALFTAAGVLIFKRKEL